MGQLLGQGPTPGVAEHVSALNVERVEQPSEETRVPAHPPRQQKRRGLPRTRDVEHNQLAVSQPRGQGLPHLDVPTDAIH